MPIYEIASFTGLSDYEDKGPKGSFKFGANLNVRKAVDSLSCNQALVDEGLYDDHSPSASVSPSSSVSRSYSPSPSPSPSPSTGESQSPSTTLSNSPSLSPSITPSSTLSASPSPSGEAISVFKDLIRTFVKCSDGYTYGFGSTGYIYRRDSSGFWMQVYKDSNGAIKGAEEKPSSSKKRYLYWATDQIVKRKEIPGKNSWNDVEIVNTNLESADWHTMKQVGGALKICNRDMLAFVGYDDSYTNEALDLIPGNYAKTLVKRSGRVVVGTYKASDPDEGINSAIDGEFPLIQVGDDGDIYFSNFVDSIASKRFPGGGKTNPGGVCNEVESPELFDWEETALSWIDNKTIGNLALFAVYGADTGKGGIYSYGRKNKNKPFSLNLEYQLDADELGALCNVNGTTIVSYQDGLDFGVKAVDPDNKAVAIYEGLDLKAKVKIPSSTTIWSQVELLMSPLPGNSYVTFYYKANKTGSWIQAKLANNEDTFTTENGKKVVFNIQAEGEIFEPRIVLTPYLNNSPEIYRIRISFN